MKNLSYFLWLCVVGLAGYVSYFFLTTTNFREQDLAVVGQQNKTLMTITYLQQQHSSNEINKTAKIFERYGTSAENLKILYPLHTIYKLTKEYHIKGEMFYQQKDLRAIRNNYEIYRKAISSLDTGLNNKKFGKFAFIPIELRDSIFRTNYFLSVKKDMFHTENITIEYILSRIGVPVIIRFEQIKAMACPYKNIIKENAVYESHIVLMSNNLAKYSPKIAVSKGKFDVSGHQVDVVIPYVQLQFDELGINQQIFDATIQQKISFLQDTTIYLSTTYTVKRKK